MPSATINPTRMELTRLKGRLKTAQRGHKLLKDKRDELMKQFMDVVRENRALRRRVEEGLMRAHGSFTVASALMSPEMLEQSLLYPKQSVELDMTFRNVMSVDVPEYHFRTKNDDASQIYPYGFAQTSGELDDAVTEMAQVFRLRKLGLPFGKRTMNKRTRTTFINCSGICVKPLRQLEWVTFFSGTIIGIP